ncbi:hypothetical protein [Fibrisoma montanum]|nr:hypothetical protein [Fibrisoma montanum]
MFTQTRRTSMENTEAATNNFLNWVEIKNFKSIKDLPLASSPSNAS